MSSFIRCMETGKWEATPRKSDDVCWLAHFAPHLGGSRFSHSNEICRKCLYMNHIMTLQMKMVRRHRLLEYLEKRCHQHISYNCFSRSDTLIGNITQCIFLVPQAHRFISSAAFRLQAELWQQDANPFRKFPPVIFLFQ